MTAPVYETVPAINYTLEEMCAIVADAFTDYVGGTFQPTPAVLAMQFVTNGIDLNLSQVIKRKGAEHAAPLGLALIARRGWASRVAMMGIVQTGQGQGVGTAFMHILIEQARERGDKYLELEVIEQNPAGVALYEKVGMRKLRRLVGYEGQDLSGNADGVTFEPVDIAEVARKLGAYSPPDMPWQLDNFTLATFAPPSVGYRVSGGDLDGCYTVNTAPRSGQTVILALVVPPERDYVPTATRLLSALIAKHPENGWRSIPVWPEEYADVFASNGMTLSKISQFQMRLDL